MAESPEKFIEGQSWCFFFHFGFAIACLVLSILTVTMDSDGEFPVNYAFAGFGLFIIHVVCLVSRAVVVGIVKNRGISKNQIAKTLKKNPCGRIWPWTARIGMLWCMMGAVVCGVGGVNCKPEGTGNCYYDKFGEKANAYKDYAIALVVLHCFSFFMFLVSCDPLKHVVDNTYGSIEPSRAPSVISRPFGSTASINNQAYVTDPPPYSTVLQLPGAFVGGSTEETVSGGATELPPVRNEEYIQRQNELDQLQRDLERRDREMATKEGFKRRQIENNDRDVPPPPSYDELIASGGNSQEQNGTQVSYIVVYPQSQ